MSLLMPIKMPVINKTFYFFSAIHSFLLGLLPIFIPVILWDKGLNINDIAWFVALSAVGFLIALTIWDRLRARRAWSAIIGLSFLLQMMLVGLLIWDTQWLVLSVGALINGAAGCFYWSTQRLFFQAITTSKNSGNTFGNFQILVVISLKLGILIGSFLLDSDYISGLILLSFSGSIFGFYLLQKLLNQVDNLGSIVQPRAFSFAQIVTFKDTHHSKSIFVVDGLFLFIESYFWVLTLYMLTQQSLTTLGLLIVLLSIMLAIIFFALKKTIDSINAQRIFIISIFGYALSWWLRAQLDLQSEAIMLYSSMLLIAFLSSFFRLAFNKRFYDIASADQPIYYILCKSYYSQAIIAVFFGMIGLWGFSSDAPLEQLQSVYYCVIPLVLTYLLYGKSRRSKSS